MDCVHDRQHSIQERTCIALHVRPSRLHVIVRMRESMGASLTSVAVCCPMGGASPRLSSWVRPSVDVRPTVYMCSLSSSRAWRGRILHLSDNDSRVKPGGVCRSLE